MFRVNRKRLSALFGATALLAVAAPYSITSSTGDALAVVRLNSACAYTECEYDPYNECTADPTLLLPAVDYRDKY